MLATLSAWYSTQQLLIDPEPGGDLVVEHLLVELSTLRLGVGLRLQHFDLEAHLLGGALGPLLELLGQRADDPTGGVDHRQMLAGLGLGDHQPRQDRPGGHHYRQRDGADPESLGPDPRQVLALGNGLNCRQTHPVPP
jgi:hypothetical protein